MRKNYLDNIRWSIVLLVVVYHVCYSFSSVVVFKNIAVSGIPQMSIVEYLLYPWFMCCLFVIAGISARLALGSMSGKQYLKSRVKKLLLPSIAGIFIYGWINGYLTYLQTEDMFFGNEDKIPGIIKYFIFCVTGSGVLWFAQELFLLTAVLLLIIKIDKKDKLSKLGQKINLPVLLFLVFAVWGSSMIFNTPFMEVYRNGIYMFMYLAGYYIFSHEKIMEKLEKAHLPLGIVAVLLGIAYTAYYFGDNYTNMAVLTSLFTNVYLWLVILAVLGCGKAWFDFSTPFTRSMTKKSYGIYILHYPVLVPVAYLLVTYFKLPMLCNYAAVLALTLLLTFVFYEFIRRVPVFRTLVLGI